MKAKYILSGLVFDFLWYGKKTKKDPKIMTHVIADPQSPKWRSVNSSNVTMDTTNMDHGTQALVSDLTDL